MLREVIKKERLIFDGAMGTQLQSRGMALGYIPEYLNITDSRLIIDIHKDYLEAGADLITTNTFGASPLKMSQKTYTSQQVITAAVSNAHKAINECGKKAYVVLDIGPCGQLMEPMGTVSFDDVYEAVKAMIIAIKDDIDAVLFETMSDLYEVKAGVLAVKENSDLPVLVTMTFESNGRTLSGCDPISMVNVLEGLGVDVLGVNCSLGPKEITPIVDAILKYASIPVMIQPNAGLPHLVSNHTIYDMKPTEFVDACIRHAEKGVSIIGGCCGTTPEFIKLLKEQLPPLVKTIVKKKTIISSSSKSVILDNTVKIVGERLNPTGKKKLKQAIQEERYDVLMKEAIAQEQAGAQILDVNVGVPGIDEAAVMVKVIKQLQDIIDLPLQIDSSYPEAIEKACRYYRGKPLINSVNGKDETMEAIFPIVKKYGGVVIGLTLDENGIPPKAEARAKIAKKIIDKAALYGIEAKDIVIDTLVLTASAQQAEVAETIKALRLVKDLGVGGCALGVSNVSFGLPNRTLLNRTFLTLALYNGLDLAIINPLSEAMTSTIAAYNVLMNHDRDAENYVQNYTDEIATPNMTHELDLKAIVFKGLKQEAKAATEALLVSKDGLSIVNEILIPALDEVGKAYESGKLFLPQLIQAAEASKIAFEVIKSGFKEVAAVKGLIVLATVEGDIHDIGKNIVKVVMESYGYQVIDLGKDVPAKDVLDAYLKYHPLAIGLSALMTPSVNKMQETIALLKKQPQMCPIMVGGAVLTQDYANQIDADFYGKDAMASVNYLEDNFK